MMYIKKKGEIEIHWYFSEVLKLKSWEDTFYSIENVWWKYGLYPDVRVG